MNENRKALSMLREIIGMEIGDYLYFCIMLRSSSPKEQQEKTEYIIRETMNIRKKLLRKEIPAR